ncbi:hypothetical protein BJY01DRAFT_246701 [Aspergillus pseudoustus]|uniref:PRISE-like Rossmann-fold domain-containing protein n=1 Tax=Aspergillus pseudoustus TaxID=1810923 RepID=A0ABR4K7U4_9EURO
MSTGKQALIFGATGISGWSLMNQCLSYPSATSFSRITGLCNKPTKKEDLTLPDDARLNIVSGIDLTAPLETVIRELGKVDAISSVDIVFFCAYIQTPDHASLRTVNTALLHTAVSAITALAPNLSTIILQTGGKGYGLEFPDKVPITPPLHEELPRIPEPYASKIFYYTQYDLLADLSKRDGCRWTFSEIRPDGIVGFAPGTNAMNMAQGIAFYLSLYREVHGRGAAVPFPGRKKGYLGKHSDTFQDVLSKAEIYVAVNQDKYGNGSVFNAADGKTVTWEMVWPRICDWFGLVGVPPKAEGGSQTIEEFVNSHIAQWKNLVKRNGLQDGMLEKQGWGHTHFMLVDFDFNREYSLEKLKSVGFDGWVDTVEGYQIAFERFVEARLIPSPGSSA